MVVSKVLQRRARGAVGALKSFWIVGEKARSSGSWKGRH